ncbi:MAG TPA: hypothetical protein VEG38_18925 [Acidimicrobiia bacterium]|nr:hypothetical protein [Acidimicrobiia bacterium]
MTTGLRTIPTLRVLTDWTPGSKDQPWTWEDEARDLHERVCLCCNQPGHYQRQLEAHVAEHGITQGICLGSDGRVWDGHHRVVAAIRLGIAQLPIEDD